MKKAKIRVCLGARSEMDTYHDAVGYVVPHPAYPQYTFVATRHGTFWQVSEMATGARVGQREKTRMEAITGFVVCVNELPTGRLEAAIAKWLLGD